MKMKPIGLKLDSRFSITPAPALYRRNLSLKSEVGVLISESPARPRRDNAAINPNVKLHLNGLRLESSSDSTSTDDDSAEPTLLVNTEAVYRLYGEGWTNDTVFVWTMKASDVGSHCDYIIGAETKLKNT
ncbi:hypothetical protein V9T40_010683 [Parthenolecanium corni]|uniref:Uncharacterized protein n=1 Tax=Parthenolecanium corni TaxID=536013 RepID=A0AAN9XXQ6_9HEMI